MTKTEREDGSAEMNRKAPIRDDIAASYATRDSRKAASRDIYDYAGGHRP